jgi:hypothetical protein
LEREALLALWRDGVPLGHAWEVFADEWSATRLRELQRTDSHLGLKHLLKVDLIARLYAGQLQAIGIESGGDAGRILIDQCYFSKTAEIDWENDIVAALRKLFFEVRVQWQREPPDVTRPLRPMRWVHPRELEAQWELRPPSAPEPFPGEQWEALDEALPNEPPSPCSEPSEFTVQSEREPPCDTPGSEPHPAKSQTPPIDSKFRAVSLRRLRKLAKILALRAYTESLAEFSHSLSGLRT